MNKEIEKLKKIEKRAGMLADLRLINELKWQKAFDAAKQTPEWKEYCQKTGIAPNYNYGDVIC